MSRDWSYIVCLDRGTAPNCLYCEHAKPHEHKEGVRCLTEHVCAYSPYRFAWCRPTKQRPKRSLPRIMARVYYNRTVGPRAKKITPVKRAYLRAGLDLAEIDTCLTVHEQMAELEVKASGGKWWQL